MNVLLPRFLKLTYRKEPISSFVLIVGAVDAVIGGVGGHPTLLSLGVATVLLSALWRWWQVQKTEILAQETARHFLPPSSSRPPLPILTSEKQRR